MASVVQAVALILLVSLPTVLTAAGILHIAAEGWKRAPEWVMAVDGPLDRFVQRLTVRQVVIVAAAWLMTGVAMIVADHVEKDSVRDACRANGGAWVGNSISGACVDRDSIIP